MDATFTTQWDNIEIIVSLLGSVKKFTGAADIDYQSFTGMRRARTPLPDAKRRRIENVLGLPDRWLSTALPESARETLIRLPAVRALLPEDDSPEMQNRRRENVRLLLGLARGARTALCKRLGWVMPDLSKLMTQRFPRRKARMIEDGVGLPAGWLDMDHPDFGVLPAEFDRRIGRLRELAVPEVEAQTPPQSDGVGVYGQPQAAPGGRTVARLGVHCGPIARALIDTLTRMANAEQLAEDDALSLLNEVAAIRLRLRQG